MPLDLLVPDLLLPPNAPETLRGVRLPALERWLARADAVRRPEATATALLASAFALPEPAPVAAVSLAGDDRPREGMWLRADPVHLRVEQDALSLHDPAVLDLQGAEAEELLAMLRSHFAGDGLEFTAPAPDRWYVKVPAQAAPRTVPLEDALGRNVFGLLPAAAGGINWPSALTEAQMLLAAHDVNARREAEGRPAVNSIWLWGEGALPAAVKSPYALVYADDAFTRGLASLSGTRIAPTPPSLAGLDAVRETDSVLVRVDALSPPFRRGDLTAWSQAADRLDRDWFVELGTAIDRFESVRIILPTGRDSLVARVTAAARWRWLRRKKPLGAHA